MTESSSHFDRRRGARLSGAFWVEVLGVDTEPRRRQGNISLSGIYIKDDADFGEKGMVRRLRIGRRRFDFRSNGGVEVMARLVRSTNILDLDHGEELTGVGFEYLIEERDGRRPIEELVRAAAKSQLVETNDLDVDCHLPALVESAGHEGFPATVRRLGTESMVLWAEQPVAAGSKINVTVRSPCSLDELPFALIVVHCGVGEHLGLGAGHTLWARYASGGGLPEAGSSFGNALTLLGEAMVPSETCQPISLPHLRGELAQVNLWSLLSFLELERRSGLVRLESAGRSAFVYLREGQLVDIEAPGAGSTARDRLASLLDVSEGTFSVTFKEVDLHDRFETPTTALLMDVAREKDEATAHHDEPKEEPDLEVWELETDEAPFIPLDEVELEELWAMEEMSILLDDAPGDEADASG